jgi:hypothetical protein
MLCADADCDFKIRISARLGRGPVQRI